MSEPPPPPQRMEYQSAHAAPRTSGLAVAGLCTGIASIVFGCVVPFVLGITAIILSAVALGQIKKDEQLRGRGMAIGGLVTGIIGTVVIVPLLISILLPSLGRARETANRVKCASNMRQIGLAAVLYANDAEGGAFPPDLETLLATQDVTSAVMVCPSSDETPSTDGLLDAGDTLSYVWVGDGIDYTAGSDVPLLFEPVGNHGGDGGNVLFADGHVSFELPATIKALLADPAVAGNVDAQVTADVLGP